MKLLLVLGGVAAASYFLFRDPVKVNVWSIRFDQGGLNINTFYARTREEADEIVRFLKARSKTVNILDITATEVPVQWVEESRERLAKAGFRP
jgi:hypothetical protein